MPVNDPGIGEENPVEGGKQPSVRLAPAPPTYECRPKETIGRPVERIVSTDGRTHGKEPSSSIGGPHHLR